jgi:hypothetical protein
MADSLKVMTPKFRVSFPAVFKAEAYEDGEPKFSVTMLFDSKADLSKLKAAAKAAIEEKWPDAKKRPANLRSPFRDGAEKPDLDGYDGCIFVRATSKTKPGLVDENVQTIVDQAQFYGGCFARATVRAYAYDHKGNRGVAFGLENIQKLSDGPAFSGKTTAEQDFGAADGADGADDIF